MKLVALLLLASVMPAAAQTWTGPFSQTSPAQSGTASCSQNVQVLSCTLSAPLLQPAPLPTIQPQTFTVTLPVTRDELIGTMTMTNGPWTAMTIVSGDPGNPTNNPPGYFEVWPLTQHIRTTDIVGSKLPPAGTYQLQVTATNASGTGPAAAITVIVSAATGKPKHKRHR